MYFVNYTVKSGRWTGADQAQDMRMDLAEAIFRVLRDNKIILRPIMVSQSKIRGGDIHGSEGQLNYIKVNDYLLELNTAEARFMVLRDNKIILRPIMVSQNKILQRRYSLFSGTVKLYWGKWLSLTTKYRVGEIRGSEGLSNYIVVYNCLSELNIAEARFMVLRDSNIFHAVFVWFI